MVNAISRLLGGPSQSPTNAPIYNNRLGNLGSALLRQGAGNNASNVGQGLQSAAQQLLGAYLMKKDADLLQEQQGVNQKTLQQALDAMNRPAPSPDQVGPSLPFGQSGAIGVLAQNPQYSELALRLQMQQQEQARQNQALQQQREYELQDRASQQQFEQSMLNQRLGAQRSLQNQQQQFELQVADRAAQREASRSERFMKEIFGGGDGNNQYGEAYMPALQSASFGDYGQAVKAKAEADKERKNQEAVLRENELKIKNINKDIGDAFKILDNNSFVVGPAAGRLPSVSNEAKRIESVVNFLKSNAELDQLVNLKDRGATFGSLTEDERRALGRTVADLDLTLPPEQLKEQFQRVKSFYDLDYQRKQEDYQRMYNPSYEIKAFSSDVEQQGGNKLSEQEAQELQALRKRFGL